MFYDNDVFLDFFEIIEKVEYHRINRTDSGQFKPHKLK